MSDFSSRWVEFFCCRERRNIQIISHPVTVEEYASWLNQQKYACPTDSDYSLYNPFNPSGPLEYQSNSWCVKKENETRLPITGVSLVASLAFADSHGCTLLSYANWQSLLEGSSFGAKPDKENLLQADLNIAEQIGEMLAVDQTAVEPRTQVGLLGNVRYWLMPDDREDIDATCGQVAGCGWSNSPYDMNETMVAYHWARTSSTNISILLKK